MHNKCHLCVNSNNTTSPKKEYLSQYLKNRQTFVYLKMKMHFYLGLGLGLRWRPEGQIQRPIHAKSKWSTTKLFLSRCCLSLCGFPPLLVQLQTYEKIVEALHGHSYEARSNQNI